MGFSVLYVYPSVLNGTVCCMGHENIPEINKIRHLQQHKHIPVTNL